MKIMFLSDIHGIKTNLSYVQEQFEKEHCDKLVVLGDLFYIGPRNELKEGYDIKAVVEFLNSYKDKIICIKGNCDSEVDQYVCSFPLVSPLGVIEVDGKELYITHGHIYNGENWEYKNSILIYGHQHIPYIIEKDTNLFINPGSISLPKENNNPSYMIYENNTFTIYDICGNIITQKRI